MIYDSKFCSPDVLILSLHLLQYRSARIFTWKNESGEYWSDVLRKNARKEFEQAKFERDPDIIVRLLVVGRDCLNQTNQRLSQVIA